MLCHLQLQEEICTYLKCFLAKGYLKDYWYDLKYLTHSLHAVYRLLYKIILTFGENGMANRCKYHHLVYGPRTIDCNLQIYKCLVKFLDVQFGIMGAMIRQSSCPKVQDAISLKLHTVIKFFDAILYHEERNTNIFCNGIPHKLHFWHN